MLTLITTPGATDANAYVSLVDAGSIMEANLYPGNWATATDEQKKAGIITATRIIDNSFNYFGSRTYDDQALEWPRMYVPKRPADLRYSGPVSELVELDTADYLDSTTIPEFLAWADAMLAGHLLDNNLLASMTWTDTQGFKIMEVGDLKLEVDSAMKKNQPEIIPNDVLMVLKFYGARAYGDSGMAKLVRC